MVQEFHPVVQTSEIPNRERMCECLLKGTLPKPDEGDYIIMSREDFHDGEILALRLHGPRRVVKELSEYVLQVQDLRTGSSEVVHGTRLKFYSDEFLDSEAIMPQVLSGMPVARLMRIVEGPKGNQVAVRWKGLQDSEDTLEPLVRILEDVLNILLRLQKRKSTPLNLRQKLRLSLGLFE